MTIRVLRIIFPLIALQLAVGCAHAPVDEHLPTFPLTDPDATLRLMAGRAHAVKQVSGEGDIELTQPNGQNVRLDAAFALLPPDGARIRTWKFGQAVFDLTITPRGVWLLAPHDNGKGDRAAAIGVSAAQLAKAWSLLNGGFFDSVGLDAREESGNRLVVRRVRAGEPTVVCTIDRRTLTVRRYEMLDEKGRSRFGLELSHYVDHSGVAWPGRVEATGDSGRIVINLRDVDLSSELPSAAFNPPRRAERLP